MYINIIPIVIVLLSQYLDYGFAFLGKDHDKNYDYKTMMKMVSRMDKNLESHINKALKKYLKAHKISKRSADLKQLLKETQNKLSKTLSIKEGKVKKFKIQRRSGENRYVVDSDLQFAESVDHNDFIPIYNEDNGGDYPAPYEEPIRSGNIPNDNHYQKRDEQNQDIRDDESEEYNEEDLPFKAQNKKPDYPSNDRNEIRQQRDDDPSNNLRSKFAHTISHDDGRGYHTSYFIPHIDKSIDDHKQQAFSSKSDKDFWKSGTNQQIVKNPANTDIYIQKTVHQNDAPKQSRSKPITARPVQQRQHNPNKPMKYSPQIPSQSRDTVFPYGHPGSNIPYFNDMHGLVYNHPLEYHNNLLVHRKPLIANQVNGYHRKPKPSPQPESPQNHREKQYRRAPILSKDEDNRKTTSKPVHWTRIVSELNEQKSRVSDDWRQKSRQQSVPRKPSSDSSSENRYYRVGASLRAQ